MFYETPEQSWFVFCDGIADRGFALRVHAFENHDPAGCLAGDT
jgi:hypothetical protein